MSKVSKVSTSVDIDRRRYKPSADAGWRVSVDKSTKTPNKRIYGGKYE
jgi:hypothetical protein